MTASPPATSVLPQAQVAMPQGEPYCFVLKFLFAVATVHYVGLGYSLIRTLDDPVHGFQSQCGYIITCTLFVVVYNDPKSH